jgi:hypothetical protein
MDLFDLFPIVPPSMPGERSARGPEELVAVAVALWLLPLVGVLLVLFTGVKSNGELVLLGLPVGSAALAYVVGRVLSTSAGRSLLVGFGCLVSCFICNACALLLAALIGFYSTF